MVAEAKAAVAAKRHRGNHMRNKLLIIGLLCASLGMAQRGGGGGRGGSEGGGDMPAMGAQNKLDAIALNLGLNKDQKKAVKAILDEGAREAAPLRDQIAKSHIAVGDAVVAKKSDDEIKLAAKASGDVTAQLSQLEMKTFAKIFATLDDTEKANRQGITRVLTVMNGIYRNKNWNEE